MTHRDTPSRDVAKPSRRVVTPCSLDLDELLALDMGPDPVALLDDAVEGLELDGSVLDLGAGKGATSTRLASQGDLRVTAVDLWVPAEENRARFASWGVDVQAEQADVRDLPFGDASFDAVVSIDAWEYFGSDRAALTEIARVLKPGGLLVVATPALRRDPSTMAEVPDHVRDVVGREALQWHPPEWWAADWASTGLFDQITGRWARRGWQLWRDWEQAALTRRNESSSQVMAMLETDGGDHIGFAVVSGHRR